MTTTSQLLVKTLFAPPFIISVDPSETIGQFKNRAHAVALASAPPPPQEHQPLVLLVWHGTILQPEDTLLLDALGTVPIQGDVIPQLILLTKEAQALASSSEEQSQLSQTTQQPTEAPPQGGQDVSNILRDILSGLQRQQQRQQQRQGVVPNGGPAPPARALLRPSALPPIPAPALNALVEMGFPQNRAEKALYLSRMNVQRATDWLLEHMEDPDIDQPLDPEQLSNRFMMQEIMPELLEAMRSGRLQVPLLGRQPPQRSSVDPALIQQSIDRNICTYAVTGSRFAAQTWFECRTCGLVDSQGCCVVCARICHAGHDILPGKPSTHFYCDCGAGETGSPCRAMLNASVQQETTTPPASPPPTDVPTTAPEVSTTNTNTPPPHSSTTTTPSSPSPSHTPKTPPSRSSDEEE